VSEIPKISILVYDFKWGRTLIRASKSGPGYEIILPPGRFEDADVVVFHIATAPDLTHLKKRPGQIWVAWSYESDRFYPRQCDPKYMRQFDLTMTYRWDSDIPVAYFDPGIRDSLFRAPVPKTASAPAASFVSNAFDLCGRYKYLKELMQLISVDSYGRSLRNKKLPEDKRRETKLETIANYKFTLAFENSISRDYVTEKFFDPLIVGSVPVYRGAPNIAEFAPGEHCHIDAAQFKGPRELAEYLLFVAGNQAEYERYLAWKEKPFRQSFLDRVEILADDPFLRLSEKVRQMRAADSGHVGLVPRLSSTASAVVTTVQRRLGMRR
jgi:Glycosyltransferase family 10 (fucosyltransferase) C-term/Fucosyltransferase, N-terminal